VSVVVDVVAVASWARTGTANVKIKKVTKISDNILLILVFIVFLLLLAKNLFD
jgi:hypothetical protein